MLAGSKPDVASDSGSEINPPAASMERIVPDRLVDHEATGQETLSFHVERYEFAARQLRPGSVLDIACGVGYGTRILADSDAGVTAATGVDISEESIRYARRRYATDRIEFVHADATAYQSQKAVANVVCLETLEHLPDPEGFFDRVQAMLAPGGVLVASCPVTPTMDGDPFHLHDLTARRLRAMAKGLEETAALRQIQPYNPLKVLAGREARLPQDRSLLGFYARHPTKAVARAWSTLRHGFANHYLTVAWRKP